MTQPTQNRLRDFFNSRSDANKYLLAEQQEDLENQFERWEREQRLKELPLAVFICNDFESSVRPLLKYLNDHHHPHCSVIVTPTNAEIVEGIQTTGPIMDYVKD